MFENSNKEVIKEIAGESMKSHKLRNLTAVLGIALTTLLITTICTAGISFYNAVDLGTDLSPAPLADGGLITSGDKYEEIRDLPQVEWAVYVRPCNVGSIHNREMAGVKTALLAPQQEFYERNKVSLVEGNFPEKADEIAISDTMAERLGGSVRTGDRMVLHPVVRENGQQVEKEIPVVVSGIVTSPLKGLASIYEEIYTSSAFLEQNVPQMQEEPTKVYVKFKEGQIKDTIAGELYDIAELVGASGVEYKMDNGFTILYLVAVLLFIFVVMFCGYLLIYNIFYISIVNDIRFFGLIKTIGTTAKQIRTLLNWQVLRLSAAGIAAGLVMGYLVGLAATPVVLARTNYLAFYRPSVNPLFFIAAVFFSAVTVYISSRKSYRLAMRISPVEAARYREHNEKKKKVWSAVSFMLSGIIFLVVFTLTLGYNVEKMVDRYHTADVRIRQDAMVWDNEEPYQPIRQSMVEEIEKLPFIGETAVYYQARRHEAGPLGGCEAGYAQLRLTDELTEEFERREQMGNGSMNRAENGDILLQLWGLPADQLYLEEENIRVLEGSLDAEKFASGRYVIYNQGTNQSGRAAGNIHAGQVLHLSILDPDTGEYVEREAEVLAVVERVNPFSTGLMAKAALTFSDNAFQEIYSGYEDMITVIQANGVQELTKEEYARVEEIVKNSFNFQLSIESRVEERESQREQKASMILIGLFLAGVFFMIGICNVVNTLVTGVLSRKLEFAAMQSVGMTKKQMCAMIGREGLMLSGISVLAAIPLGVFFCRVLGKEMLFLSGFSAGVFAAGCGILLAVMCGVSICVAVLLTRFLTRRPVVERLREAE